MQLNKELSTGFVCIALFYTTCHHVQSTECTFPWLQSKNLNILLIVWAVMCNTFNANMKTAIKLQLNKTLAQYIEQKHDRVSTDTIVHVEVQTTAPGIQELHVVGYFYTSIL